jgi:hypothetical protein
MRIIRDRRQLLKRSDHVLILLAVGRAPEAFTLVVRQVVAEPDFARGETTLIHSFVDARFHDFNVDGLCLHT